MTCTTSGARLRGRRRISQALAATMLSAVLVGATACGSDSGTGPAKGPEGVYPLQQVDGSAPPVEIHHGPYFDAPTHHFYNQLVMQVTSGTIELDDNANFSMEFEMEYVGDGEPGTTSLELEGSYTVNGSDIVFLPNIGGSLPGRLQGKAITLSIDFMQKDSPLDYTFRR